MNYANRVENKISNAYSIVELIAAYIRNNVKQTISSPNELE